MDGLTTENFGNDFSAHVKLLQKNGNPSTEHKGAELLSPPPGEASRD